MILLHNIFVTFDYGFIVDTNSTKLLSFVEMVTL